MDWVLVGTSWMKGVWTGKASSGNLGGTFEERWEINLRVKVVA